MPSDNLSTAGNFQKEVMNLTHPHREKVETKLKLRDMKRLLRRYVSGLTPDELQPLEEEEQLPR